MSVIDELTKNQYEFQVKQRLMTEMKRPDDHTVWTKGDDDEHEERKQERMRK